jgi:hypothetical protein
MRQLAVASLVALIFASPVSAQPGSYSDGRSTNQYYRNYDLDRSSSATDAKGTSTQENRTDAPNGEQRSSESRARRWNYKNSSERNWNSDGLCFGKGLYRQCN